MTCPRADRSLAKGVPHADPLQDPWPGRSKGSSETVVLGVSCVSGLVLLAR